MIIPPYSYTLEDPADVPLEDAWYARPQLFFSCWFRPVDGRPPSQGNYTRGPDDFEMHLVFFSTFEELKLTARSPMDDATTKLYEPSPSTPRNQFCSWPPTTLCWVECPYFPCSLMATPLPRYHTICAISEPALSSMGPPMPPHLTGGGEATLTR